MNVGSLFSGIGGIDLGLERAGMRVVWNAERDEWCRGVLLHHWPAAHQYADVRDVARADDLRLADGRRQRPSLDARQAWSSSQLERHEGTRSVDVLCGGFPCQDLSVAGKRAGLAGARSGLFHEFARISDALRPEWLLIENVPGLLSSNDGRDFGVVLHTLAELGYGVAWRVLDSRYFGVPQRRRRVFIVARLGGGHRSALRALCESCEGSPTASECSWQGAPSSPGGGVAYSLRRDPGGIGQGHNTNFIAATDVSPTLTAHHKRDNGGDEAFAIAHTLTSGGADASEDGTGRGTPIVAFHATQDPIHSHSVVPAMGHEPNGISNAAGVRRLTPRECERLQGFPDDWTLIPGLKCPDSRRYAAMGNAVTTNVAEWIGRRITATHHQQEGTTA